ncbi:MAG: FAD-linked oxidase C-terminal domain-containing protein, partial [bacterium]
VRLIVGSEGTLAIVTKIKVKLIPHPETQRTFLVLFDGPAAALDCAAAIGRSSVIPAALEFMDERVIRCALAYQPMPWLEGAKSALLIELDGARLQVDADTSHLRKVLAAKKCLQVREATEEVEREQLWEVRRALSPATLRVSPHKISEDITVPRSKQLDVLRIMEDLEKKYGIEIIAFSHAGDGNFHVNFMLDEKKPEQKKMIDDAVRELFERAIALGGTLSGEHGIGNTKSRYLGIEYGQAEIEMMKKVKVLWDPLGLLNPGKIFP